MPDADPRDAVTAAAPRRPSTGRPLRIAVVVPKDWHAPELVRAWARDGHDVVVVTTLPERFTEGRVRRLPLRTALKVIGRLRRGSTLGPRLFTRLAAVVVHLEHPDVVVAWSGTGLELPLAGRRAVLVRGNHHAVTQRDLLADAPAGAWRPSAAEAAREVAEYARYPVVTVPTAAIAADPRWGEAATLVSGYGFPTPVGSPSGPAPDRGGSSASDEGATLVMVGEPGWRKGADRLATLADAPSVARVLVAGGGGDTPADHPRVGRLGSLRRPELDALLGRADAFVLLSREEGQARAGLEAMAAGLPIVVTARTGLADACEAGAGVVVSDDADVDELDRAVRRVVSDRDAMSATALHLARSRTWADHAGEVLAGARPA